ncbi:MAG: Allophanate hydrolase [Candidatus Erwinia impunctatus]|nr:Allophanate hydrolase [Culicoides impunctatus]
MTAQYGYSLAAWQQRIHTDPHQALTLLQHHLAVLSVDDPAWITLATNKQLEEEIARLLPRYLAAPDSLPLFGIPFAVKDNIDVAGWPTTAACPAFMYTAQEDATAVARLREAGAIVIGKTNLDQFATGLVGTRSPYGAVVNTFNTAYVSGGSSSGSASVTARGWVPFALGTDTAGSGRVPAGFNNIVGLKPTKGWLSAQGVVPACRLNDTISVFALNVTDAFRVANLAGGYDSSDAYSRHHPATAPATFRDKPCFAIPDKLTFFGDAAAESAWLAACEQLEALGVTLQPVDFSPFRELAEQLYQGTWVAERTAAVGAILDEPQLMDPTVCGIIASGKRFSAVEAYQAEYLRAQLSREIARTLACVDALLVPTSPTIHTLEEMNEDPIGYNSQFGTYTNFTNLADLAALALPAPFRDDGLPAGITLIAPAWHDRALAEFGCRWQSHMQLAAGATSSFSDALPSALPPSPHHVRVAVVGAHLQGMPLNHQLTTREARFVGATTTAPCYGLYALANTQPAKPGLVRENSGDTIALELWDIPLARFGEFVAEIPAPLGIGNVELKSGEWVKGFICEPDGLTDAENITAWKGWRNWLSGEEKSNV